MKGFKFNVNGKAVVMTVAAFIEDKEECISTNVEKAHLIKILSKNIGTVLASIAQAYIDEVQFLKRSIIMQEYQVYINDDVLKN